MVINIVSGYRGSEGAFIMVVVLLFFFINLALGKLVFCAENEVQSQAKELSQQKSS